MLHDTDHGAVITPGDPRRSLLIQAVRYDDEPRMPPGGKLADEAIEKLTAWVKIGAPWPADTITAPAESNPAHPRNRIGRFSRSSRRRCRASRRPIRPRTGIDYFIGAELEHED